VTAFVRALAALAFAAALACAEPTQGPVRVVWGRHACDHCGMAVSERRFAAQVRRGPRDVVRFDDFGCAVRWLEEHGGPEAAAEIWVMDSAAPEAERWLDARSAAYRPGQRTPMGYGFAAVGAAPPDAVGFEHARLAILEHRHGRPAERP
jgi:nitrous oxide reductase accessory protein NosL